MSNIIGIDLGYDRLIAIASDLTEEHNFIGALKMLNKNAVTNGNDCDSLMLYAEIYDDMGLHEKSVNAWFRFMDFVEGEIFPDCLEGLAVGFMNLGNEHYSAFYYNKLLKESGELDRHTREEILRDFIGNEKEPLKFVYPPEIADCTEIMEEGIAHMRAGEFDLAAEEFLKVDERNEKFAAARNYVAMCRIIADRTDEAEQECLNVLKHKPDDVQTLTTLAAVKTEQGEIEEAVKIARKLLALNPDDPDEIYKIATVCCENKMHAEAYSLLCNLSERITGDMMLMYFKAVSAFNCGKRESSLETFDDLVTVYPEAVTARYHYDRARRIIEEGSSEELSYFYRLPKQEREDNLKIIAAELSLSRAEAVKIISREKLNECILWCFDEAEGANEELKTIAAHAAAKGGLDDTVRNILLDAFIPDKVKLELLVTLAERNREDCFGVVICNIYKRLTTYELTLGSKKKSVFVKAYARLFAHFALLNENNGATCATAAENLYNELAAADRLTMCKNSNVLAAVIYLKSGIKEPGVNAKTVYEFFGVTEAKVNSFLREI